MFLLGIFQSFDIHASKTQKKKVIRFIEDIMKCELNSSEWIKKVSSKKAELEENQYKKEFFLKISNQMNKKLNEKSKHLHLMGQLGFSFLSDLFKIGGSSLKVDFCPGLSMLEDPASIDFERAQKDLDYFCDCFSRLSFGYDLRNPQKIFQIVPNDQIIHLTSKNCANFSSVFRSQNFLENTIETVSAIPIMAQGDFCIYTERLFSSEQLQQLEKLLFLDCNFEGMGDSLIPKGLTYQEKKLRKMSINWVVSEKTFWKAEYLLFIKKNIKDANKIYDALLNSKNPFVKSVSQLRYVEILLGMHEIDYNKGPISIKQKEIAKNFLEENIQNQVVGLENLHAYSYYYLAMLHTEKTYKDLEKAIFYLIKISKSKSKDALHSIAMLRLAQIYAGMFGEEIFQNKTEYELILFYSLVKSYLEKACLNEQAGKLFYVVYLKYILWRNTGITKEEFELIEKGLRDSHVWEVLGFLYDQYGTDLNSAVLKEALLVSSVIDGGLPGSYIKLAHFYFSQKKYIEAASVLELSLSISPYSSDVRFVLGNMLASEKLPCFDIDRALQQYEYLVNAHFVAPVVNKIKTLLLKSESPEILEKMIRFVDSKLISDESRRGFFRYFVVPLFSEKLEHKKTTELKDILDLALVIAGEENGMYADPSPLPVLDETAQQICENALESDSTPLSSEGVDCAPDSECDEVFSNPSQDDNLRHIPDEIESLLRQLKYYNKLKFSDIKAISIWLMQQENPGLLEQEILSVGDGIIHLPHNQTFTFHKVHKKIMDREIINFCSYWKKWRQMVQALLFEKKIWQAL